jgi:hypothetical protein
MLALSRSGFAIKEASAVRRFRQPLLSKHSGWPGSGVLTGLQFAFAGINMAKC